MKHANLLRYIMKAVILAIMPASTINTYAQSDMILTQHWAMPTIYNPARTGETDFLRIRGGARLQWMGIDNAPKSFSGTADIPLRINSQRAGAGVFVNKETIGLFSNLLTAAQGSFKIKCLKGELSAGIQAGYYNSRFRSSDIYIPGEDDYHDPDDPALPQQDLSGNAVDVSIGLSYSRRSFHIGLSAAHLTSPRLSLTTKGSESTEPMQYESELRRTLYFDTGGNIPLRNTLFQLQPSLLMATDLDSFSANISLLATYNKFLTLGLGYRWDDAMSVMVGASFRNFFIGYAFDYPTSAIARVSSGSHEIVAGYQIKLDFQKKDKHKHSSIRIM